MTELDLVACVQKRLGARMREGDAPCRICCFVLDPQLEHCETYATAVTTRGHYSTRQQQKPPLKIPFKNPVLAQRQYPCMGWP